MTDADRAMLQVMADATPAERAEHAATVWTRLAALTQRLDAQRQAVADTTYSLDVTP